MKKCKFREDLIGCRNCVSNSKHICENADANLFIEMPVYSDIPNEFGKYKLIGYRRIYIK